MSLLLDDATSDNIAHGTALGNFTAASWAFWYYPTGTLAGLRGIMGMWDGSFIVPWINTAIASDELRLTWRRAGAAPNLIYETNNANISVDKWWYVCVTVDQAAGAGVKVNFYVGDLATAATLRTNGTTTDSASGYLTNSGAAFMIGDNPTDVAAMGGRQAGVMMWPGVVLTDAQATAQQWAPVPLVAGCQLFCRYGVNPNVNVQPDWSGRGNNGTQTGAAIAPHVPARPPFGGAPGWRGTIPSAAVTITDVDPATFEDAQAGIVITGIGL